MSSVIGILNKQAVALAADSAVTISRRDNRKIFNTANKIFTLSKYHPVGVMVYNSASFMGTPWEIIIKMYRDQLKNKSFKTVKAYQEDFFKYLRSNNFFSDREEEDGELTDFFIFWMNVLVEEVLKDHRNLLLNPTEENKEKFLNRFAEMVTKFTKNVNGRELCTDFKNYTQRSFSAYTKDIFDQCLQWIFDPLELELKDSLKSKLRKFLFYQTTTKDFYRNYTGLIFVGYGDKEIYPQLIPVHVSFVLDEKLRAFVDVDNQAQISSKNSAAIRPFAQTDVINTVLSGIDPELDSFYTDNFMKFLQKYNRLVAKTIEDQSQELADAILGLNLEKVVKEYIDENFKIRRENYINPLMSAVGSLSKEDLAEMAESLIYLTYLKRRITFKEESVGGPVDVALITKGDGFIWIKRKHYFDPKLNHHFFKNYLE
ncbi:hypothetical protein [Gracilimonas mengyeensis]|uniref:Uncharacterized protein n=1 Tax=Gracilimonas mengyeensis TaxID=1302730 RepID=A0A521D2U9_9BACT|nr:hypothetical protein [Gracilimonas mengyeensis]SMO66036.1 hypothetical protein SAMN06265219_10756 [Gracilimonas mengyeensis]